MEKFLESIDWRTLDDIDFVQYTVRLRKENVLLRDVVNDIPEILKRIKNIYNSDKYDVGIKKVCKSSYRVLKSVYMCRSISKISKDSSSVSFEKRKKIIDYSEGLSSTSSRLWGTAVYEFMQSCRCYTTPTELTNNDFDNLRDIFENFRELYDSCEDKNDFYMYLYSKLRINFLKLSRYYSKLCELYFCSVHLNSELNCSSIYSYDDIRNIGKMVEGYKSFIGYLSSYDDKLYLLTSDNDIDNTFYNLIKVYNMKCVSTGDENQLFYMLSDDISDESISHINKLFKMKLVADKFEVFYDNKRFLYDVVLRDSVYRDYLISKTYENHYSPKISCLKGTHIKKEDLSIEDLEKVNEYEDNYTEFYYKRKEQEGLLKEEERRRWEEERRLKQEQFEKSSVELMLEYLEENPNSNEVFCEKHKITLLHFNKVLKFIKDNNPELYDVYSEIITKKRDQRYVILYNRMINVLHTIMNCDDEYVLLDYYRCTKFPIEGMYRLLRGKVTKEEQKYLTMFYKKYGKDSELDKSGIRNIFDNLNIQYKLSDNSIYKVTDEVKEKVLVKLYNQGIPITTSTFNLMLKCNIDEMEKSLGFKKK